MTHGLLACYLYTIETTMIMMTCYLTDERSDPDADEDWTMMNFRKHVGRQVKTSSTQLVTKNHHHERVEYERVMHGRYTAHSVATTRLHAQ